MTPLERAARAVDFAALWAVAFGSLATISGLVAGVVSWLDHRSVGVASHALLIGGLASFYAGLIYLLLIDKALEE